MTHEHKKMEKARKERQVKADKVAEVVKQIFLKFDSKEPVLFAQIITSDPVMFEQALKLLIRRRPQKVKFLNSCIRGKMGTVAYNWNDTITGNVDVREPLLQEAGKDLSERKGYYVL